MHIILWRGTVGRSHSSSSAHSDGKTTVIRAKDFKFMITAMKPINYRLYLVGVYRYDYRETNGRVL
jgi:hypothetical protein